MLFGVTYSFGCWFVIICTILAIYPVLHLVVIPLLQLTVPCFVLPQDVIQLHNLAVFIADVLLVFVLLLFQSAHILQQRDLIVPDVAELSVQLVDSIFQREVLLLDFYHVSFYFAEVALYLLEVLFFSAQLLPNPA